MQITETVRRYFRNRRAIGELRLLDDARLTELGISRAHIESEVKRFR